MWVHPDRDQPLSRSPHSLSHSLTHSLSLTHTLFLPPSLSLVCVCARSLLSAQEKLSHMAKVLEHVASQVMEEGPNPKRLFSAEAQPGSHGNVEPEVLRVRARTHAQTHAQTHS